MHIGVTCTKFTMKYLCAVEVSRNRRFDWIIDHWSWIWISVPFPLPYGPENTNLHSPQWVLSIQSGVLEFPLEYCYQTVSRKSSPDLWKRVNFKSSEDMVQETRKGTQMHDIIPVKRQQGKGHGESPNILSALLPQATPQGLCFLLSQQLFPSWLDLFITFNYMGINIVW